MVQGFADRRSAPGLGNFTIRRGLLALGLMAAAIAPAGAGPILPEPATLLAIASPQASPALWEIRDGDTTIFLFGTFHTLDARTRWFDRTVRSAFDRSGELVLETIVPNDPAKVRALGRQSVGGRDKPGSYFASTRAVISRGRADGLSVEHGADAVLKRAATEQGKALAGLERFEDQLNQFARISAAPPAPVPAAAPPSAPVTLNDLLAAWKVGDTGAFSVMLSGFEAKSPAAYRILIADRNARWGEWIANRLDQPGIVFVAVGSGHLSGKDSVQNWLSSKGIVARRIS